MPSLSILHTSDLHGRWTSDLVESLSRARAPDCLLLDCGDALRAGNLNPSRGHEFEAMAAAGYDTMAIGNRETHLWWWAMRRKLRDAPFTLLSSNMRNPRPPVEKWRVWEIGGARVGVFALTPVMVAAGSLGSRFASVVFDPPIEAARVAAASLGPTVDLVVALSHSGREFDRRLAREVAGIDLIIGGHDHTPGLPEGERVGSTLLTRTSPYGENFGEVEVSFGPDGPVMNARLITVGV
ncbi:MAG TPA: metallophosphoesterase [Armatimonadota bacterium]|nr:metallophosphoesterase [Armatimonadota bacterium]